MRGSDVVDLLSDLLPRKVVRAVGSLLLLALLATGTFQAVALWYIQDKQEGIMEDVVGPAMERIIGGLGETAAPLSP